MGIMASLRSALGGSAVPARPQPQSGFFRGQSPFLLRYRPALRENYQDIQAAWPMAAARAVDTVQNSGFIAGLVDASTALVVGPEMKMSCRPDRKALGWSEDEADDWAEAVEREWSAWAGDPEACDAQARMTFGQMQQLSYISWLTHGETLAMLPLFARGDGALTKVLMMPPSRLANKSDGMGMVHGVRIDRMGAALAYAFISRDREMAGFEREVEIPRLDRDGRLQIVHCFEPTIAATRGISPMAPILKVTQQIDQLADATLTAALIQTIFAATIRTDMQGLAAYDGLRTEADQKPQAIMNEGSLDLGNFLAAKNEWYDNSSIDLFSHGRIAHLMPNEQLDFHAAKHPNDTYDAMMQWLMREVSRGLGVTYESATNDYRGATYSSIRMANADTFNVVLRRRANITVPFSQRVYATWLEDQVGTGRVPFPGGLDAFLEKKRHAARASWTGPPKPQADDLKTARAQQALVTMGISSLQTVSIEYGTNWEDEMEQRARETRKAARLGLPNPHPFPENPDQKREEQGSAEDKTDDPSYAPDSE